MVPMPSSSGWCVSTRNGCVTGWRRIQGGRLQVDSELARLRKTPAALGDDTRAARDGKTGVPFVRRRYVLLCLALAALERSDRQTALGRLADDVVGLLAGDPAFSAAGVVFDLSSRDQRRDLVQVIRFLILTVSGVDPL